MSTGAAIITLVVVASTVWVGADAAQRDWRGDRFANASWKWVLGTLLLWIVVFPVYLARRGSRPVKGSAAAASQGTVTRSSRRNVPVFWWGVVSAATMAVGAFAPWVEVLGISRSGIDNFSGDGWFVLALALVCLLCVFGQHGSNGLVVVGTLAALAALGVAVYDRHNLSSAIDSGGVFAAALAHVGWGLNLVLAASVSAAVQPIVAAKTAERRQSWKATPAARNVLVGPDGGLNIPHKTALFEYAPDAEPAVVKPKPGWYVDPDDEERLRYWDGEEWQTRTAHLDPGVAPSS